MMKLFETDCSVITQPSLRWLSVAVFLVLNLPAFLYTVIGILVTARVWASLGIFLEPSGMPVFTSAFVFVTWLMLLAASGFQAAGSGSAGRGHDSGRQSSTISNGSEEINHFERKRGLIAGGTAADLKYVPIRTCRSDIRDG